MDAKFSAHMDMFLTDLPVNERIEKFRAIGFSSVELWCWWEYDLDELAAALKQNEMILSAICTKFAPLTDIAKRDLYLEGLNETIETCRKLDCKTIISQVGQELNNYSREEQKNSIIAGLKEASALLAETGITLVIEPLNVLVDHVGYFLSRSDEAAEIINTVENSQIKMLFDIYHQQITEGNLINNITANWDNIGHFHIADNPGRSQPGTGEINYQNIFRHLEDLGNCHFIALEFLPKGNTVEVLKEFRQKFIR